MKRRLIYDLLILILAALAIIVAVIIPEIRRSLGLDGTDVASIPTLSISVTDTPVATLDIAFIVQTLDAQATIDQATLDVQATAAARATGFAIGTLSVLDQTATAASWTDTPTPNITASIEAYRTQQVVILIAGQTATAAAWTDTPTSTPTSTATLTPSGTPTPSLTATFSPEHLALTPVASNAAWTSVERDFDGVTMVLVPSGCFIMGSTDEQLDYAVDVLAAPEERIQDEKPAHQQCLPPFWIDKTEVTNGQFEEFDGQALRPSVWLGDNRPRANITWLEARDFCILRDARLPTEREWEYAARGPDNNIFPWGNLWEPENAIWNENSNHAAEVGSRISGASWVGALDMSGNVYEWTSSLFIYPYDNFDSSSPYYVLRGGGLDVAFHLRTANRVGDYPTSSYSNLGFRCVRSYDAES